MTSAIIDRVTGLSGAVAYKPPCVAATTANITLAGLQTIDGVALAEYDRVLVMNQTDNTTNGIYIASTGTWQRAADFDDSRDAVNGTKVAVTGGSTLLGAYQLSTSDDTVVFGTTSIVFISGGVGHNDLASTADAQGGTEAAKIMTPATTLAEINQFRPILDATTAGPTADGQVALTRKGGKTAYQIYSSVLPANYYFWDTNRSVLDLEAGTTVQNADAYGAYTYNGIAQGVPPNSKNAVGFFALQVNAATGAATWGINTAVGDSYDNTIPHSFASTCVGYEADFTIYNVGSIVQGISLLMQGGAQPAGAAGVTIGIVSGSSAKWLNGFSTGNGACTTSALSIGATAVSGNSVASQKAFWNYFNSGGVSKGFSLQVAANAAMNFLSNEFNDGIYIQPQTSNPVIGIAGTSTDVNLQIYAKGVGSIVANSPLTSTTTIAATGALSGASVAATGAVTGASVAATGAVTGATVAATGSILSSGATAGVGYATGAGGTVTQGTSRTTGVTINKAAGAITLFSAAGATSVTPTTFTVTNSAVAATDVIVVNQKSGTDKYELFVTHITAGSFDITFFTTGGTTTEQPVFNFAVIKAVAA